MFIDNNFIFKDSTILRREVIVSRYKRRMISMHFFSAQQDWNSERLEFGVRPCQYHHITSRRRNPVSSGSPGKPSRSSRRLRIKHPFCTKLINAIYTFCTCKISIFDAIFATWLYPLSSLRSSRNYTSLPQTLL